MFHIRVLFLLLPLYLVAAEPEQTTVTDEHMIELKENLRNLHDQVANLKPEQMTVEHLTAMAKTFHKLPKDEYAGFIHDFDDKMRAMCAPNVLKTMDITPAENPNPRIRPRFKEAAAKAVVAKMLTTRQNSLNPSVESKVLSRFHHGHRQNTLEKSPSKTETKQTATSDVPAAQKEATEKEQQKPDDKGDSHVVPTEEPVVKGHTFHVFRGKQMREPTDEEKHVLKWCRFAVNPHLFTDKNLTPIAENN